MKVADEDFARIHRTIFPDRAVPKIPGQCPHTAQLRPELGALPKRLQHLPLDSRGYPVPWFVDWIDGEPEFRAMSPEKFERAINERRCWVCGDRLGSYKTFVAGPMCVLTRTSAEPPSHYDCAEWSAQNCPFLTRPNMERREDDVINNEGQGDAAILRNPGCTALVTTKGYRVFRTSAAAIGWLIEMGEFERVEWFAEGRPATRAEVEHSVETGLPLLRESCEREATPERIARAGAELMRTYQANKAWWPDADEAKGKESQ